MQDKFTTTVITSTKNYEMFKLVKSNRVVKQRNVERLMKSFAMTGGMSMSKPIIVDKNFNVIDGQNRLMACKKMDIPVHYIVSDDKIENIPIYNSYQEKWGLEDYAHYWAEQGNENYKKILEVRDKVSIALNGVLECLVPSGGYKNDVFKEGRFVFEEDVDKCVEYIQKILQLCYVVKGKRNVSAKMLRAIRFLSRIKTFDLDILLEKIMRYQGKIYTCATSEEYIQMFTSLYNYKIRLNKISPEDLLAAKNI